MPFEVFRRHQKKLIAIFGIMAMFAFVVSDSLPRLLSSNTSARDQPVVTLYGRTIYHSDLNDMQQERMLANQFISRLSPYGGQYPFGELKTRDMVDALILKHEADRLGIPAGPEVGKEWLKKATQGRMNAELFEALMSEFNNRVRGEQVLAAIAGQVRLESVRRLLGAPMVTPYDVYRAYRDQNERTAARLVEVPVDKFLPQVPDPTDQEVRAYYDKYKDVPPDPSRPTPGFKVPRQVQVEVLSIDGRALTRAIKDKLTEADLRAAYDNRKATFELKPGPGDLPADLFAGHPELTPPIIRPFEDVRSTLADTLAEEKAQAEIEDKFNRIQRDVLDKFFDDYQLAQVDAEEGKADGQAATPPQSPDVEELAKRENLHYELSPMLSRQDAENYGLLARAVLGLTPQDDANKSIEELLNPQMSRRTFVDEFFDPKTALYESVLLTDSIGTRYLVRKVKDAPPRVPSLEEVRPRVALAWKTEKARPLAEKAARQVAEQLKKQAGPLTDSTIQGYRVVTVPPIPRQKSDISLAANRFEMKPPEESPIPEVPFAGEDFRRAYFSLQPDSVAVAHNQPETSYYAMKLDHRDPATFAALYAPNGDEFRYKMLAREQADRRLQQDWMGWLRKQAGVDANWAPPEEARENDAAGKRG